MVNNKYLKFVFLFLILFGISFESFALKAQIGIDETSKLTKLLAGQYSIVADGELSITNPSNLNKIYEFKLPIELDSLIGINKVDMVDSGSNKFKFDFNSISGYLIEPGETIKVKYHIYGLLNYDLYENMGSKTSILEYYIKSYDLVGKVNMNLQKSQRGGFEYLLNGSLNATPNSNTSRLISSEMRNPTDFDYFIENLKIYKTDVEDPFFAHGIVIKTLENVSLDPFEYIVVDVIDENSDESSVYWMSTNVLLKSILSVSSEQIFTLQSNPAGGKSGGEGNFDVVLNNDDEEIDYESLILKKEADKTIINNGEEFKITLRVVNVNGFSLYNLSLHDILPEGYEVLSVDGDIKMENREFEFIIGEIGGYETKVFEYSLIAKTNLKGITYLKPAKLIYNGDEVYSEGILLINDLIPGDKIFVQKEVKYLDDNFAEVTIKVKNLGSYFLEDILISEDWDENSLIKDISQVFFNGEKGSWIIKKLGAGDEWEVSYIISGDSNLDSLPNIFGVEKKDVFGTLIFNEEIIHSYKEEPQLIEKVGLTLAVGFLIIYLLF